MKVTNLLLALSIALGAVTILPVSEAEACGNKMYRFKERPRVVATETAEWHLRRNETRQAIDAIHEHFQGRLNGHYQRIAEGKTERPRRSRQLHMVAAATARSGGVHGWLHHDATGSPAQIVENLAWARVVLDWLAEHYDESKAYRAEALLAQGEAEAARVILEDLADRDAVPDATSWATLAQLRRAARDVHGAVEADDRAIASRAAHGTVARPRLVRIRTKNPGRTAKIGVRNRDDDIALLFE